MKTLERPFQRWNGLSHGLPIPPPDGYCYWHGDAVPIRRPPLPALLSRSYGLVRQDSELGPIFNDAVDDWPEHLADFRSSVMLGSGRYKGSPLMQHLIHARRITPAMFGRWLSFWKQATGEMLPPDASQAMQAKAARIAESLQLGLGLVR